MIEKDSSGWFVVPNPKPNARHRLFCFPYAGGSVSTYLPWLNTLNKDVELVFVQPPGRGARLLEKNYTSIHELVQELLKVVMPYLDKSFFVFGHSMGAKIGFEFIHVIENSNCRTANHFIASGSPAPNTKIKDDLIHTASEAQLKERLRKLNATPEEVLDNRELMSLILPAVRGDFKLAETYQTNNKVTINSDMSMFRGIDDEWVSETAANNWRQYCAKGFSMLEFSGGHMFIEESPTEVVQCLNQILDRY